VNTSCEGRACQQHGETGDDDEFEEGLSLHGF
jgi:hypothetical protein